LQTARLSSTDKVHQAQTVLHFLYNFCSNILQVTLERSAEKHVYLHSITFIRRLMHLIA